MKVIINAGGKGTRISSINPTIPKPLIKVAGKPILERIINTLVAQGFGDIIITVSYLAEKIVEYFGDGSSYGAHIIYYVEDTPLGTAGAIFKLKDQLLDDFLLINSDILFDIDLKRFLSFHKQKNGLATILAHPNSHPYDSSILEIDNNNSITKWFLKSEKKPRWYKNIVNAGIHILSPKLLQNKLDKEKIDLDKDILMPLQNTKSLFAYCTSEYVKDMGTPERLRQAEKDLESGIVMKKSLLQKQFAIFLDRDGTINKYVGFLKNIDQFELINGVSEAIRNINNSYFLSIVVTNQPVIARGEVTYEQLDEIHKKMETLLGEDGAYLDAIYICPHHPDKGFAGEIKELKIDCDCRKPKPGMLLRAEKHFNIDLNKSWMIGDSEYDILAGKSAGCKTILITNNVDKTQTLADFKSKNLLAAVKLIMSEVAKYELHY